MYHITSRKNIRAQALLEFIMIGPMVIFSILCFTYLLILLDNQQRLEACLWYALRAESFVDIYSPPSTEEVQSRISGLFGSEYKVAVNVTSKVDGLEDMLISFPVDPVVAKSVELTLTYPNILKGLNLNLEGTLFNGNEIQLSTSGSMISSVASGL